MKGIILFFFILSLGSIITGYLMDFENSEQLIGVGVLGLFFIVFPLFSYHRWKDKDIKDYLLTKENLDKMKENQKNKKLDIL